MTRSSGAVALATLWICFAFSGAARAIAIHSFSPADVTIGTRLVIQGDFADLVASGARPKVQGTRVDTPRMVTFQVLTMSRNTIIARVRDVPSSKNDPAAGKSWSLRVHSPLGGGETAEADETFTTAGPELIALLDNAARPGQLVSLYAFDPGQGEGGKRATVKVGGTKTKVVDLAPAGKSADDDPWQVRFRAPNLRNGFYPVRLQNSLGRASELAELLIFGGQRGGLAPFASAVVQGGPGLEAPLCGASAEGAALRVSACDGPACARELELAFEPDPNGELVAAAVSLRELAPPPGQPELWVAAEASAQLVASPAPALLAGTFVAELQPADDPAGPRLLMRGYFQAPAPEAFAAR